MITADEARKISALDLRGFPDQTSIAFGRIREAAEKKQTSLRLQVNDGKTVADALEKAGFNIEVSTYEIIVRW